MTCDKKNMTRKEKTTIGYQQQSCNLNKNCIYLYSIIYLEMMQNCEARFQTFKDWPNAYIKPQDLADAGFFYKGIICSILKCKLCGVHQNCKTIKVHTFWADYDFLG